MLRIIGVVCVLACAASAQAADYVVLVSGRAAGHMKVAAAQGGPTRVDFSFRDNGRGPDIDERFTVDDAGFLTKDAPGFGPDREGGAARVIDDSGKKGDANDAVIKALIAAVAAEA